MFRKPERQWFLLQLPLGVTHDGFMYLQGNWQFPSRWIRPSFKGNSPKQVVQPRLWIASSFLTICSHWIYFSESAGCNECWRSPSLVRSTKTAWEINLTTDLAVIWVLDRRDSWQHLIHSSQLVGGRDIYSCWKEQLSPRNIHDSWFLCPANCCPVPSSVVWWKRPLVFLKSFKLLMSKWPLSLNCSSRVHFCQVVYLKLITQWTHIRRTALMCWKPVIEVGDAWFDNCLVNDCLCGRIGTLVYLGACCVWAFEVK